MVASGTALKIRVIDDSNTVRQSAAIFDKALCERGPAAIGAVFCGQQSGLTSTN